MNATNPPSGAGVAGATKMSAVWPAATRRDAQGNISFHGYDALDLVQRYGSPLYVMDTDEVRRRAKYFVEAARNAFPNTTTHVSFAAKAFISKEICRIVAEEGMTIDTCTLGEMRIALAAGVPGRRLVLHGNNKTDEEIALAIDNDFAKIVLDSPDEAARVERIARAHDKRAKVMLRVTVGVHAGGHEYISTAHEDQKFGVPLLAPGASASVLTGEYDRPDEVEHASEAEPDDAPRINSLYAIPPSKKDRNPKLEAALNALADGPAIAALKDIRKRDDYLELVGVHSHIGSQIHDADAFIEAVGRVLLLRKTFYATDGYVLPEIDLGGGYSVPYLDSDSSMDVAATLRRIAKAFTAEIMKGLPAPVVSFEPGRFIVGPAGVTLYRVGTVKPVVLSDGTTRTYVSVDGGMSDNIRPALYGADYEVELANRVGSGTKMLARVVGKHCESGDIVVKDCHLPADIKRGDILAVPVTGAYGRTMASNYNQALRPAVVAVSHDGSHVMIRRETIDDLLGLDVSQ
ncbi:diaminopimelate decarboxylase [Pseudoscardovia suis]|uniref:Diaminopimelate decarboxylase n=2 Tax=Pseudoscardovia suis TaxID=987063 RepID=A0A261F386_9BIFI|nr:diaminopimelate decarboxylase [Pseudoscardovia suis]PJJ68828.1 diaminopimelate decarboxylase [Pseudoscardovia suis]